MSLLEIVALLNTKFVSELDCPIRRELLSEILNDIKLYSAAPANREPL